MTNIWHRLKLQSYANANKAGKFLANRIKTVQAKSRITQLIHPTLKRKVVKPQEISNQFADYYNTLYNLKEDSQIHNLPLRAITAFWNNLNLPTLSDTQLWHLNYPFTSREVEKVIASLTNWKITWSWWLLQWILQILQHITMSPLNCSFYKGSSHLLVPLGDAEGLHTINTQAWKRAHIASQL